MQPERVILANPLKDCPVLELDQDLRVVTLCTGQGEGERVPNTQA